MLPVRDHRAFGIYQLWSFDTVKAVEGDLNTCGKVYVGFAVLA